MPRSIFMPEMTNLEVREYLEGGGTTVIVPVGSTEDHGDQGPLWTDVYIPLEIARRAAPELDAIVCRALKETGTIAVFALTNGLGM